jgi:hypothetical protein
MLCGWSLKHREGEEPGTQPQRQNVVPPASDDINTKTLPWNLNCEQPQSDSRKLYVMRLVDSTPSNGAVVDRTRVKRKTCKSKRKGRRRSEVILLSSVTYVFSVSKY